MPYKDEERAKEANRRRQARHREKVRLSKIAGKTESSTQNPGRESFSSGSMADWTHKKVELGEFLIGAGKSGLNAALDNKANHIGPRDAVVLIRLGLDLVNSNLAASIESKSAQIPETASDIFDHFDPDFNSDPVFMDLAEKLLIRKSELFLEKQKGPSEDLVRAQ